MKVTVDFDCTPEEARRFMGLPDLTEVHAAYVDKMKKTVADGIGPDHFLELMKNWAPMSEGALTMWKTMFDPTSGTKK